MEYITLYNDFLFGKYGTVSTSSPLSTESQSEK